MRFTNTPIFPPPTLSQTPRRPPPKVHVACDNARYECDAPPSLAFRPTMMFATRAFALRLTNTGLARLDYAWRVLHEDGRPDASGGDPVSGPWAGWALRAP
jgi:hypothetical protein